MWKNPEEAESSNGLFRKPLVLAATAYNTALALMLALSRYLESGTYLEVSGNRPSFCSRCWAFSVRRTWTFSSSYKPASVDHNLQVVSNGAACHLTTE